LFVYTAFLMLTLGSKSGLIGFFFILGGYLHFHQVKFSGFKLGMLGIVSIISIVAIFSWLVEVNPLEAIYYRLVSFGDGPVYYFAGDLDQRITRPFDYSLDILFTNLRIQHDLKYDGLGFEIISRYFDKWDDANRLFGPNPQFITESKIIAGWGYYIYIIVMTFFVIVARKIASNAFAFMLISMIVNPGLIDSQLPFANLLTVGILMAVAAAYKYFKDFSRKGSHDPNPHKPLLNT
jgi:hypothetical protein